jgi:alpha-glucosidase (family GH31 glycosyl hydrolase)
MLPFGSLSILIAAACGSDTSGTAQPPDGGTTADASTAPDGTTSADASGDTNTPADSGMSADVVLPPTCIPPADAGGIDPNMTYSVVAAGDPVPAAERTPNGNPILPPKWAFGVLWGSYYDQIGSESAKGGNLVEAAQWLRCSTYGGDLLWIDSSWLWHEFTSPAAGPHYICFQFDPATFPDPRGMIQTLQQNHFHFGLWQWPWMGHGCQYYDTGVSKQYFVMKDPTHEAPAYAPSTGGNSGAPWHGDTSAAEFDFTNPDTVTWWKTLNQDLVSAGLDMLKLDSTQVQQSLPLNNGGAFHSGTVDDYTQAYHQAGFDVSAQYSATTNPEAMRNGGRGFILVHGDPGQGRNFGTPNNDQTPGMWTGDTRADWTGLDCNGCAPAPDAGGAVVVEGTQGNSDIERAHKMNTPTTTAYWGGDTGGYDQVPNDETYIRWLEYSTFTPLQEFFGAKSTGIGARFPWLFGQKAQAIALQYNKLRYRFLPFRYSNAQAAYQLPSTQNKKNPGAAPVNYPVAWNGDALILSGAGDSQVLVQPVTAQGAKSVSVNFPPGQWIDYWAGTVYPPSGTSDAGTPDAGSGEGGASNGPVTVPVDPTRLDIVPIFVKAGSIIPMGPVLQYVDQVPADPLTLDTYPGGATSYTLYEDDGLSQGYMGGAYSTTKFSVDNTSGKVTMKIDKQVTAKYQYAGQLKARTYILSIHGQAAAPAGVTRDSATVAPSTAADFGTAMEGWYYDSMAQVVWVKFHLDSSAATSVSLQ